MFSIDAVQVVRPFEELSENGVIGRPSLATPEIGRRIFVAAVERGAAEIARIAKGRT
jgi:creatinine amidohydrolase